MQEFISAWQCPSNIALVKYWGKKPGQLPANPSISFTLSKAYTQTKVEASKHPSPGFEFYLDNKPEKKFEPKILNFFTAISHELPFLKQYYLKINSHNSFPHSAGIASSASAMGALALCLTDLEHQLNPLTTTEFINRASFLSRIGSGSASRSIIPQIAMWGHHPKYKASSDLQAVAIEADPRFHSFQDLILIIDSHPKAISSSAGHKLMDQHPFASSRYNQANENIERLLKAFYEYDLENFIDVVEEEAMTLHALMMCSRPGYTLMKTGTLEVIQRIKKYRTQTGTPVAFTLDAGPNVHVLFPAEYHSQVQSWVNDELLPFCEGGKMIYDQVGAGPQKI